MASISRYILKIISKGVITKFSEFVMYQLLGFITQFAILNEFYEES